MSCGIRLNLSRGAFVHRAVGEAEGFVELSRFDQERLPTPVPVENREITFTDEVLVKAMSTGNEVHMVITKGLLAEEGRRPRIVGARYEPLRGHVVLEFDRPVPDQLLLMSVPPL